ncbi:leptin receptor isoform X2 [Puntigrus tetrazona]|uniref:leptin receptor isoform X2 n=1 Tax=Puntigrus tetrazona TaxID=1606681 RepID=UPI001C89DA31|nr:leptin receptor isoform X2 [Puntigrus tetrazona]
MSSLSCRSLFIVLALLVNFITISQGLALSPSDGTGGVYEDLKWKALLCCELPLAQTLVEGLSEHPPVGKCRLLNATNPEFSRNCLDILCWLEGEWTNLICNAKSHRAAAAASLLTVRPQLVVQMNVLSDEANHAAQCAGEDTTMCSISLHGDDATVSLNISISLNGSTALSPKMQVSTHHLRRPEPPVNLHYDVTTEGEVIFRWSDARPKSDAINYEIRYSSNSSLQQWEVVKVKGRSWVSPNELSSGIRHTIQVRYQSQLNYWSEWSQPFYFTLDVSYIPAEIFTRPGSEVTVYAVFHNRSWSASKAVWMLNGQVKIPESQYTVINEQVSAVTVTLDEPGFDTLMCCHQWGERFKCIIAYAKIYTEGMFNADITCQSKNSEVDTMSCEWNKSAWAQVRLLYRQYTSMCETVSGMEGSEEAEENMECSSGAGDHRECTLRNLSLFSCYKIWLEVEGGHGKVRSFPVYVAPIDYVKPSPPSVLEATTLPNKTLSVSWRRPHLPVYDMQYELRFVALRGMANTQWKVIGPLLETQAEIRLEESCVQFKIEVRCRRLNGSGYWSDWSMSYTSAVYNSKAPEMGPDFWRVIQEDPVRSVTNVTLIIKPVQAGDSSSCVEGLVIEHQASGRAVWSNETAPAQFHSFQWRKEAHTVTVMSRNALGISTRNRNMTLLHQPKRRCVRSFSAVANSSCVHLSWSLLSDHPVPQSFVIEWQDLKKDPEQDVSLTERLQWVRVQSASRDLSLCRRFYGSEEFTLYPVFVDGEGEPVRYTATRGDPAAYILLLIIAFLSVVLFVTLLMSQNQMRKLMWKDVPNPNNCSWARGTDFRQIDTIEHLFPHSEGLTACPLLLVSESICEVEIIEKTHPVTLEHEKDNEVPNYKSGDKTTKQSTLSADSSEPLSLEASTAAATPETSGQSSVTYSTVLLSDQPSLLRKQQESLSSSSDEGNFSANNSDISGSFPGGLWDLENHVCSDSANPRHSSSYNSVEEFSETSDQDYEASESTGVAKDLYYLEVNEEEEEDEEEIEETQGEQEKNEKVMKVDARPLLEGKGSTSFDSNSASHSIPLYLPQFRTECINPP